MKRVVAIHDLSCYAKASLTIAIPVLSALGAEVSVLPTALLSTQTDGFEQYHYLDLTDSMQAILTHWNTLKLSFDAVYSGFLGSERQIAIVGQCIDYQREHANTLVLIDPVLGDNGAPYGPISSSLIEGMRILVSKADIVTPNPTEAALLLNERWERELTIRQAIQWARRITDMGPMHAVITGLTGETELSVVCYDRSTGTAKTFSHPYAPDGYPGAGDMFASILCGLTLNGMSFFQAVETSASISAAAIFHSWESHVERRHGVEIEALMCELIRYNPMYKL